MGRPKGSLADYANQTYFGPRGGRGDVRRGDSRSGEGGRQNDMRRPGFPSGPRFPGKPNMGSTPKPGMSGGKSGSGQTMPQDVRSIQAIQAAPGSQTGMVFDPSLAAKKNGGKVSKYAKGGAVKMTAGAGSGSGRLEKVAAHKAAKRVPATGLKMGGKVKGK